MRVLFISNWSLEDGLTQSTVIPHLKILVGFPHIEQVVFCTVERSGKNPGKSPVFSLEKVDYQPLFSRRLPGSFLRKMLDIFLFPQKLVRLCRQNKIDFVIARGAPAGALAREVLLKLGIPFMVESFEPHADYMLESGVWGRFDPRYLLQKSWEKKVTKDAKFILPVSQSYVNYLKGAGVPCAKMEVLPCCVNGKEFSFDKGKRTQIRQQLGISPDATVGVYVGKFGGIYYDDEAYILFKSARDFFGQDFFMLILTPDPEEAVRNKLLKAGFREGEFFVSLAPHSQVVSYLSAADFAFSPIKPAPSRKYCSPVKDGEYWASGLPVLIAHGVGDDSRIVEEENAGAVFMNLEKDHLRLRLEVIKEILADSTHRTRIASLAEKYRSFSAAENVYAKLFGLHTT